MRSEAEIKRHLEEIEASIDRRQKERWSCRCIIDPANSKWIEELKARKDTLRWVLGGEIIMSKPVVIRGMVG